MRYKALHYKIITNQPPDSFWGAPLPFLRSTMYTLLRVALRILGVFYCLISSFRLWLYEKKILPSYSAKRPVISIGNITVGGTGKTPLCLFLIDLCQQMNISVGLISRGYGNDESLLYQKKYPDMPVCFHKNRVLAAQNIVHTNDQIQVIISDDSFQHRRLHRSLDIVLLNSNDPFGHNFCLPGGFLREPICGLKRADICIITHANEIADPALDVMMATIKKYTKNNTPILKANHQVYAFLNPSNHEIATSEFCTLPYTRIGMISGIASPVSLKRTLQKLNINPIKECIFEDHYHYSDQDFKYFAELKQELDCFITTEKDLVKIPKEIQENLNIYTVKVAMQLSKLDTDILTTELKKL